MQRWQSSEWVRMGLVLGVMLVLVGCGGTPPPAAPANSGSAPASGQAAGSGGQGILQFRANGEDFIRQGFVSSDGWSLSFEHVYVTLANMTAYQSNPPFDAQEDETPQADVTASLAGTHTVDLATGADNPEPVLIGEVEAPAGRYNALSWNMVAAVNGPASGAVIMIQGTAEKDGETVPFTIRLDEENAHTCGDYIGDERKGILADGGLSDLEATFHFDHLFGDGSAAPDDEINTGALGFEPFAALAEDGQVDVTMDELQAGFSAEDYARLESLHLAHVGEGHCTALNTEY